jgi:DNA-binding Lrp family transcriptional regulator
MDMVIGFVMISVTPPNVKRVYNELSKVAEIVELNALFGEYDLMVKIEAENVDELAKIVIDKIRTIQGVSDTRTLRGVKLQDRQNIK